jgi:glutamate formiminotransferase
MPNAADQLVECVPNFSEGRVKERVRAIVAAMRVEGVSLLDWSLDADHNRSVVTIAGSPSQVLESAVRGAGAAAKLIDLNKQKGEHPRIGAADVIPFVPISGISLEQCALLAHQAGREIWHRFGIPSYFYEAAATRPDRALLEEVRRGQFEGLRDVVYRDPTRRPDVGGPELHVTAGASAIGARKFLVAYNVYLDSTEVAVARAIAKDLRASSGGLKGVKAMGVLVHGRAQVSMNITDLQATSIAKVYAQLLHLAKKNRVTVSSGEIIGLIPEAVFEQNSEWVRQLVGFNPEEKILERRINSPLEWPTGP